MRVESTQIAFRMMKILSDFEFEFDDTGDVSDE